MFRLPILILRSLIRRVRHSWLKLWAKKKSFETLDKCKKENILVICYGNIYRSPFVEQVLIQYVNGNSIDSAGFYPVTDRMSPDEHRLRATKYGLQLDEHRSKLVSQELFDWADLIVIMDANNYDAVRNFDKNLVDKIFWLGSLDKKFVSIDDPYGWSEKAADRLFDRIYSLSKTFSNLLI